MPSIASEVFLHSFFPLSVFWRLAAGSSTHSSLLSWSDDDDSTGLATRLALLGVFLGFGTFSTISGSDSDEDSFITRWERDRVLLSMITSGSGDCAVARRCSESLRRSSCFSRVLIMLFLLR